MSTAPRIGHARRAKDPVQWTRTAKLACHVSFVLMSHLFQVVKGEASADATIVMKPQGQKNLYPLCVLLNATEHTLVSYVKENVFAIATAKETFNVSSDQI